MGNRYWKTILQKRSITIQSIRPWLIFLVLWAGMVCIAGQGVCSDQLVVGWEPWEPYQYQNRGQQLTGLDIELIKAIASDAGAELHFEKIPWKRQLAYLKTGEVHLAMGASKTRDREKYAYYSDPYRTETIRLYVRSGESSLFHFNCLADIMGKPFQLGISRGYYYGERFAELMQHPEFKSHVQEVPDDTFNYEKLLINRLDGFLADPLSCASVLRSRGLTGKIEALPITVYTTDIYIMFSKKSVSPATVNAFNNSLIRLKNNGSYHRIMENYLK